MPTSPERFLVTGAAGCIGAWALRLLLDEGVPVVATDLSPDLRRFRLISQGQTDDGGGYGDDGGDDGDDGYNDDDDDQDQDEDQEPDDQDEEQNPDDQDPDDL